MSAMVCQKSTILFTGKVIPELGLLTSLLSLTCSETLPHMIWAISLRLFWLAFESYIDQIRSERKINLLYQQFKSKASLVVRQTRSLDVRMILALKKLTACP